MFLDLYFYYVLKPHNRLAKRTSTVRQSLKAVSTPATVKKSGKARNTAPEIVNGDNDLNDGAADSTFQLPLVRLIVFDLLLFVLFFFSLT